MHTYRKPILLIAGLSVIVASAALIAQERQTTPSLFESLQQDELSALGLDKLSQEEQQQLFNVMPHLPHSTFMEAAAAAYMRGNGWRPVHIVGGMRTGPFSDDYMLFLWDDYTIYRVEPSIAPEAPVPGVYWGYNIGSHWKLLYPDGETGSFGEVSR